MGHARHIGRVGALAVALGIGSAIAWPSGVAGAEPDTGTSVSPGGSGDTPSNTVNRPSTSESTDDSHATSDADAGDDDTGAAPTDEGVETPGDDDESPAPELDDPEVTVNDEVPRPEGGADAPDVETPEAGGGNDAPRPTHRQRTVLRTAPVEKSTPVVAPNTATDTKQLHAEVAPVAPAPAPVVAAPTVTPAVEHDATDEAPPEEPAMTTALLSTLLLPGGTDSPAAPADSPLAWALLAFARRQGNQQSTRIGSGTPTVSTGELVDAADDDNNPPTARVVVGAPSFFGGRVSGRVIGSDADRDRLTYSGPTETAKGTVVVSPTGRFTYTPTDAARHAAAQDGATDADTTDTFVMTVDDGNGGVTPVSVTVRIRPANARPDASSVVGRPDLTTGAVAGQVSATDPDDDPVTFEATDPAKGSVVIDEDGSFVYTPTAEARDAVRGGRYSDRFDRFSVTVNDGHGGTDTITVTVAIAASDNAAPVPGEVSAGSPNVFNGAVRGQVRATDPDGDRLTFSGSTTTEKGFVFVTSSGRFVYTPTSEARHAAAATGAGVDDTTDTFVVTVVDAYGGTAVVPVTVDIAPLNSAPSRARATAGTPDADTGAVEVTVTARDADRDPLTFTPAVSEKGTVVDNGEGSFTFTPTAAARQAAAATDAPEEARFETLTFTVDDGHGGTTTTTVRVAISPAAGPVNSNPTGGTFTAGQPDSDGTITGQVSATDPDGDPLSYSGPTTSAKGGTVVVNGDGTFSYDPTDTARHTASALGASTADKQDTFTVTVSDGNGGTLAVPVTVTILPRNAAPVGSYSAGSPDATGKVTGAVTSTDADNDTRTYSGPTTSVKGGTLVVNADGTFTYTPTAAARQTAAKAGATEVDKTDSFVVTVNDGHVGGAITVTVSVAILPAPNSAPTNGTANPGQPDASGKVSGTVTATDANGDPLTYSGSTSTAKGSVVVNADGTFLYTPTDAARHAASALTASAADKQDTFTVTVSDGRGGTLQVPVTVTINPNNAAPQGSFSAGAPASDGAISGTVTSTDADGDVRTYSGPTTSVKGGTVTLDAATGAFTYKPTAAMREQATQTPGIDTDTFTVTVTDGHGGSTPVQVSVTIAPNVVTTESTPGLPLSGVIAAPGGALYQVTTSFSGGDLTAVVTRVSVLTEDGRVLATTADIAGFSSLPLARPDGSLLVTTTDPLGAHTSFASVDSTGTLTPILSLDATLGGVPVMAQNGTVYFVAAAPDESGGAAYTLVAITGNVGRTYGLPGLPGGLPVVAPDGTAYLPVGPTSGVWQTSVLIVRPDGTSSTTNAVTGRATLPMAVGTDGTAYLVTSSADESTGRPISVITTFAGTAVTTRTIDGSPASQLVAAADGSVLMVVLTYGDTSQEVAILRLTPTGVTSSMRSAGYPQSWPMAAADGTAFLAIAGADGPRLMVMRADGTSTVVVLPGDFVEGSVPALGLIGIGPDSRAYVPLLDGDGQPVMAVITPAGTQTIRSLDGLPTQPVVFGPGGTAYQVVETYDSESFAPSTHVVNVSTGAATLSLPGSVTRVQGLLPSVAVGSDGTAYLVVADEDGSVRGIAFDSTGATLGSFTDHGVIAPAVFLGGLQGVTGSQFVFGPDGTAYVTIVDAVTNEETGNSTAVKTAVYAMNAAGITKVLEVPDALTGAGVTVASDGTVYLSTATVDSTTLDGVTTVRVITPPSVL
ncbi:Ig-like domain-containing protein [Mycobacterium sp. PSTR-4-N]|uniref:Ig-like domain-containing protein n=1 Tax=Mycobacterium sp. PSTR-4-N TaxID=2917745 RepID=UPI001F14F141|nr:Ig-like domain-containing protein [Mycobacterium sp. PSTR-4-N]MCG7592792.1 Ig-like domain-containing protein [Mycobacterium sp. PSTR-4-N]